MQCWMDNEIRKWPSDNQHRKAQKSSINVETNKWEFS